MTNFINCRPRDTCGSCLPPSLYYDIRDSEGRPSLRVEGPACKFECCASTTFRVSCSRMVTASNIGVKYGSSVIRMLSLPNCPIKQKNFCGESVS